eukprot:5639040-Prymnesium_polylepis.1
MHPVEHPTNEPTGVLRASAARAHEGQGAQEVHLRKVRAETENADFTFLNSVPRGAQKLGQTAE